MWRSSHKYCHWLSYLLLISLLSSALAQRPTVALVLSGGGARGLAQIGVLKVFERYQIPIDVIAGTSIGAVIGGLYAAGYSAEELDSLMRSIHWEALFALQRERERTNQFLDQRYAEDRSILQLRFRNWQPVLPQAISEGYRIATLFQQFVWNAPYHARNFDSLRIPFRAVATDLVSGQAVILRRGDLARVLRASATIPIQYTPVEMDSLLLVDGGLVANIPIAAVQEFKPDIVVVVNTTSPLLPPEKLTTPWAIADQVVSVAMRQNLQAHIQEADVVITPALGKHPFTDFTHLERLIALGEEAAEAQMSKILALLQRKGLPEGKAGWRQLRNPWNNTLTIRSVEWLTPLPIPLELDSLVCAFQGMPLNSQTRKAMVERTARWFRRRNFAFGALHWIAFDTVRQTLWIDYTRGVIDTILITGYQEIPQQQIRQFLPFREGQPFRTDAAIQGWKQLMNSGLFADAAIRAEESSYGKVRVVVSVRERATTVLRIGGRVDNERHSQIFAELSEENAFHRAHQLALWVGGGQRNLTAELRFRFSQLILPTLSLQARVFYQWWHYFRYRERLVDDRWEHSRVGAEQFFRYGIRLQGYRRIQRDGLLLGELRFEFLKQQFEEEQQQRTLPYRPLLTATVGLVYDSRNNVDFPDSGRKIQLSFESPLLVFPNGYHFSKALFAYQQWVPISATQKIAYGFFAGFGDRTLPRAEYFRLGGERTFPGLYESQWVGTQTLQAHLRWRYQLPIRILFDTYLEMRAAVAGMWNQPSAIQLRGLRYAVGLSLMIATPIGPASLTVGRGIAYRDRANWTPVRVFFQIGKGL